MGAATITGVVVRCRATHATERLAADDRLVHLASEAVAFPLVGLTTGTPYCGP